MRMSNKLLHGSPNPPPLAASSGTVSMTLGEPNMMKHTLMISLLTTLPVLCGCGTRDVVPQFQGRVVSHVDTYGSATGGESELKRRGSMRSGFDYGDTNKPDWTSDIKWQFLRSEGAADLYRVEWTFRPINVADRTRTREVSFDGVTSTHVFSNEWQVISIEPALTDVDSQQHGRQISSKGAPSAPPNESSP